MASVAAKIPWNAHWEERVESKRPVLHQCGYNGCRVGEASNPGPVQTRSAKLRTTQLDSDPEVVTGGRYAVLSGDRSEDDGPATGALSSADLSGRDIRVDSACRTGRVRNARKRLRLSQASTVVAPPDLGRGATIEHELKGVHNSVGDIGDGIGLAVVERAVDAQSHDCVGVAQFAEAQTSHPSRRLVLVETQADNNWSSLARGVSVSPTIIDALQDDLGVSSASTVPPISRPIRRLSLRGVEDLREVRRPGTGSRPQEQFVPVSRRVREGFCHS